MQRPDPAKMASNLFSRIDTKNQGYIDKAELQSAFDQISSGQTTDAESTSSTASNVESMFKAFDTDSDGKITKQELTDGMQKLADALDSQFNQSRMNGPGGPGGPGGGRDNAGFTKDELISMAQDTSDGKRSAMMTNLVNNFEKADTSGDGRVSGAEAMTFDKASKADASTAASPPAGSATAPADASATASSVSKVYAAADTNEDGTVSLEELIAYDMKRAANSTSDSQTQNSTASMMKMMMQLMQAYGGFDEKNSAQSSASISVTA